MVNKLTSSFRLAVEIAYDGMGGHQGFTEWARKNPTEFYRIASKLIPLEIRDSSDNKLTVVIRDFRNGPLSADSTLTVIDAPPSLPDDSIDHG